LKRAADPLSALARLPHHIAHPDGARSNIFSRVTE
jgi:hypothetical protein